MLMKSNVDELKDYKAAFTTLNNIEQYIIIVIKKIQGSSVNVNQPRDEANSFHFSNAAAIINHG